MTVPGALVSRGPTAVYSVPKTGVSMTEAVTFPTTATDAAMPIVRLDGVSKTYDQNRVRALGHIELDIVAGEFFSLLGPSGSGKTTMLRLIAGFEEPDTGRVFIDGADVTLTPPYQRDVNTVFQNYALYPHMTVAENLAYPLKMKRGGGSGHARRVDDLLTFVDMGGYEGRLPHQLSGGQRQRVALARALIGRPKVVLLDEPLGALDLQLREQMQTVLKRLQREVDITFVYVTHDQGEALSMSDRLAVMHDGEVQQIGTPEEVYYRPDTRFVAGFIGHSNLIDCQIKRSSQGCQARVGDVVLKLDGDHAERSATIAVRWEAIEIGGDSGGPEGPGPENGGPESIGESQLEATVETTVFHGETHEVTLAIGEMRVTALVPAKRGIRFDSGQRVRLAINPADVVILRD